MFGIPTLLKKQAKAVAITLLGNSAGALVDALFGEQKWGIYVSGTQNPGVYVSSVVEIDVSGDASVSDYPIENGSFTSYNKVINPNIFGIRITQDGSESLRSELFKWLERNIESTDLYDIVCPENTWTNSTLLRYRTIRNAESGASMVTIECVFQQVRELPVKYSSRTVKDPENQESSPTVRVNPIPDQNIQATDLGPL